MSHIASCNSANIFVPYVYLLATFYSEPEGYGCDISSAGKLRDNPSDASPPEPTLRSTQFYRADKTV